MATGNIFISYRRDDAPGHAGRIYDRLDARFPGRVSMDIAGLNPGADFIQVIRNTVSSSQVLVAIIGKSWLSSSDSLGRRRIDEEHDFVRIEISTALSENILTIPVLVQGTWMPPTDLLPADLQPLAYRNALQISDEDFHRDLDRLIQVLEKLLVSSASSPEPPESSRGPDKSRPKSETTTPDSSTATAEADLVFVCYDREDDEEFTLQLATRIKEQGVNVWIDQWNLEASEDWDRSIDEALSRCARFLIVLSPSSVNSDEVRGELRFALDEKKPIVPVLYKDCMIPRRLRLTQRVDFRERSLDDQAEMDELIRVLKTRRK